MLTRFREDSTRKSRRRLPAKLSRTASHYPAGLLVRKILTANKPNSARQQFVITTWRGVGLRVEAHVRNMLASEDALLPAHIVCDGVVASSRKVHRDYVVVGISQLHNYVRLVLLRIIR